MTIKKKTRTTNQPKKERFRVSAVELSVAEPPSTVVKRGKDWVYFGDNNLYPQHLIDLYENSPTHGAIISGKTDYIVGRGLVGDNDELNAWLKTANNRGESYNDLLFKTALDGEIMNTYYVEIVRNGIGEPISTYHLDASRMRCDEEEQIYFYSDEWAKPNGATNTRPLVSKFILFDEDRTEPLLDENGDPFREMLVHKEYRPSFKWYSYPNYMNVLTSIEAEKEIANYDLNQWKYGFLGATMVNFNNGEPTTPEEKKVIDRAVKDTIGGSGGTNILINYADSKDTAAEIVGIKGENSATEADLTAKRISSTIFTGHKVTSPLLFGVKTEGQLGGRTEILESYELFKEVYIQKRQTNLVDFFTKIKNIMGINGTLEIEELKPIQLELPISELKDVLPMDVIIKEIAEKYGLDLDTQEVQETPLEMSKTGLTEEETKILEACSNTGYSKDNFNVVAEQGCTFNDGKLKFAELSELDLWILKILGDNPEYSATEISEDAEANGFTVSIGDVFERLGGLAVLGWISKQGAKYVLSRLGEKEKREQEENLPEVNLMTVYSYELRPDAQPLVKKGTKRPNGTTRYKDGESREFCKEMVAKNLYYTKEQIDGMNNNLGTDVWMTRGGWMGITGTDTAKPFCRHWWVSKIVSVKEGKKITDR